MSQPPAPIQPSVNPGYANRYISDPLIGGGQISTTVLPTASAVAPGTDVYDSGLGPMYSDGAAYRQQGFLAIKKHPFMPKGMANVQSVMASPPTIAIATVNPLAAGQLWAATNNSGNANFQFVDLSNFGVTCSGNPIVSGTSAPDPAYVSWQCVSASTGTIGAYNGSNVVKIRVVFTSSAATPILVLQCKGISNSVWVKVNDQYATAVAAPVVVPTNGAGNFISLTFAAPGTWTVEFIAGNVLSSFRFGGMWTATGDILLPAQTRGPRILVMGDSFTTSTGAGPALGFVNVFAEYMGWDDVWPSGIGGTGLLAPGTTVTYGARVQNDIIPFAPDELIIQGFFNDGSSTGAAEQAAMTALITAVLAALPTCRITVFGPCVTGGVGFQSGTSSPNSTGVVAQRTALAAAVASFNSPLVRIIDPTSFTPTAQPALPQTILNAVAAAATSFVFGAGQNGMPGLTYQFPDGSRTLIISGTGTATVDKIANAQSAGTVITPCPGCYITGGGHQGATTGIGNADNLVFTDGIHPSPAGHLMLGAILGQAYAAQLNT